MGIKSFIEVQDLKILLWLNHIVANWGFLNKLLAEYLIYLLPIVLLVMWFSDTKAKKVAMRAFVSAMVGALVLAKTIGQFIHRSRPFDYHGVKELLFHQPDYSFPSDHATVFFAIAFSFWLSGNKKIAVVFFILALVNGVFRVATGLHWPSDILAGLVLGLVSALIVYLLDRPLNFIYEFIIKIARKIKLA